MATNTILTPTIITRKALMILHQKCNFIGSINRQYDDRFAKTGAKIGSTLGIKLPNEYTVRTGRAISVQDTEETKVDLTVATQKGVDIEFSSAELTMDIDNFASEYLEPAMAVLAANMESDAFTMANDVYNTVDASGGALDVGDVLKANKILTDCLTPLSQRTLNCGTQAMVDLVTDTKGLFNDQSKVSQQYREGLMGSNTLGFGSIMQNTLIPRLTHGAANGSYLMAATVSVQGATSISLDTGTGAAVAGQTFTIAGVNRVHPETKADTGVLQQFVIAADFAGGTGTATVSPAMYTTGGKQNISAFPANNAAVTFLGTAGAADDMSLAYHKDAFAFVSADLEMPKGVDFASRQVYDGISMRIVRQYDISTDQFPCRIDVLYGYQTLRAQLATKILNN